MRQGKTFSSGNSLQVIIYTVHTKTEAAKSEDVYIREVTGIACLTCLGMTTKSWPHRRRIKTEEKANVVAAVWGIEFIPCRASYFAPG